MVRPITLATEAASRILKFTLLIPIPICSSSIYHNINRIAHQHAIDEAAVFRIASLVGFASSPL
jgi:hypothetical protein